jgi:hypothetical protein
MILQIHLLRQGNALVAPTPAMLTYSACRLRFGRRTDVCRQAGSRSEPL